MTERDYKKSENATILVELRCYDWISDDVSWVPHVLWGNRRQALGGDRLRAQTEIMRQSARRTYGYSITVYVHWIVFGSLLELHGQHHQNKYDCWSDIAPCIAIHALTYDDEPLWYRDMYRYTWSRYDTGIAGPSIAMHQCLSQD